MKTTNQWCVPESDREQEVLDSYQGLTRDEQDRIIAAFVKNGIGRSTLLRMLDHPRAFSVGVEEMLRQRPYSCFRRSINTYHAVRTLLRMRVAETLESGKRGELKELYRYFPRWDLGTLEHRVYNVLEEMRPDESGVGYGADLPGLQRIASGEDSLTIPPHDLIQILVPMFDTIDRTFGLLHDALLASRERWRDYSPSGVCGISDGQFVPNKIAIMDFGFYEPKKGESMVDVERWMKAREATPASYECLAALIQCPDILLWLERDPKGGRRQSLPFIPLHTVRPFGKELASDELFTIWVRGDGAHGMPIAHSLYRNDTGNMDRYVFPFVLPGRTLIDM